MAFLSPAEIAKIGFKKVGNNLKISDKASFHGVERISIGDNTRIDDFCVISAGEDGIDIGRYVHVACLCSIIGHARIELHDFCGISSRTAVYSSSDDFSGDYLTGPTVPKEFTHVISKAVVIGKHVIVGSGCVILPGVHIGIGSAVGALSLVATNCEPYSLYVGNPAKFLRPRSRKTADLEKKLMGL